MHLTVFNEMRTALLDFSDKGYHVRQEIVEVATKVHLLSRCTVDIAGMLAVSSLVISCSLPALGVLGFLTGTMAAVMSKEVGVISSNICHLFDHNGLFCNFTDHAFHRIHKERVANAVFQDAWLTGCLFKRAFIKLLTHKNESLKQTCPSSYSKTCND